MRNINFFSKLEHELQTKNKLQKELLDALKKHYDRQVIPASKLNDFKNQITAVIIAGNKLHPRCTPVKATWQKDKWDWSLHLEFITIRIYIANN